MILQNIRYAFRQLARNPGFTLTVLLTLALSVGANTAIFSLVNALLIKPLPYPAPERLGMIFVRTTGPGADNYDTAIDGAQWEQLRDDVPSLLSAITGGFGSGVNLQAGSGAGTHTQYLHAGRVSAHYFEVLGIHPLLGRGFTVEEDTGNGDAAAVLSYKTWQTAFEGSRAILGQRVLLKGAPYTVVGVLAKEAVTPLNVDVYTTLRPSTHGEGGGTNYDAIVRLRNGATWQQADAEIARAWADRSARYASNNPGGTKTWYTVPLQKGSTSQLRPHALWLQSAAGFILLIACANLAGLALVRTLRRSGEMATRLALGATSWQIQKQLWIENLLLAVFGGAAGIGVGFLALRGILLLLPEGYLPVQAVTIDYRVLLFTLAITLAASLLFGMLPALATRKVDLRSAIASHAVAGGGVRLRQVLIAGEVALTVILLAAAGLMIRTLVHLETLPSAFNPNGLLTAKVSLDDLRYHDAAKFRSLLDQSTAAMRQIPGVDNAAVGLMMPYERALNDSVSFDDGPNAGRNDATDEIYVTPGYFATLEIPMLAGREFTAADGPDTQPVVIVNQSFVRKFYGGGNPIGHIVNHNARIIGVVADTALASSLSNEPTPLLTEQMMYIPAAQMNGKMLALVHTWFQPSWVVRSSHPVTGLSEEMQSALASADPSLPVSGFYSMDDLMAKTLATQRIEVALLSTMAGLALLLSSIGIFSMIANLVLQRTREIGIRIALGSSIRNAMFEIGRPGLMASIFGLAAGLAFAAGVLRMMRSVLYGVQVYDAATIGSVIAVLAVVTVLAIAIPSLRVARIDPARTLRED